MTPAAAAQARHSWRGWPVWAAPRRFVIYLFVVEAVVAAWCIGALGGLHTTNQATTRFAVLLGLALIFEEGARKAASLRIRLSAELHRDMASVWSVPAALVLPAAYTVALISALYGYIWFRQQRPAGEALYRKIGTVAIVMPGCLAANAVVGPGAPNSLSAHRWALAVAACVVCGIALHAAVNRALVTVGLSIMGVRGKSLAGTADENLIEFATLCLGGLTTITVVYQPWLTPLVLAPMVSLQRGSLVRQLEHVASTDVKTGLLNAIAWEHVATRELERAGREGSSLAVLIIDLDFFKRVNDRFGHLAGDKVLKAVGAILTAELRGYDSVGRFGGEEFVAVLPGVHQAEALAVAERIRTRISVSRVTEMVEVAPIGVEDDQLTVSIGVALWPVDGDEIADLLHAADSALYAAKENGRNQVQLARRGGGTVRDAVSA